MERKEGKGGLAMYTLQSKKGETPTFLVSVEPEVLSWLCILQKLNHYTHFHYDLLQDIISIMLQCLCALDSACLKES